MEGKLGNLNVVSADLYEEFRGKVERIEIDSPPSFPELKQYHLFVKPLDIKVKGSFDNPRVKLDFSKALNALVKKELKKQEKKIKDKVKKDLQKEFEKKLGNKLKNLLKF